MVNRGGPSKGCEECRRRKVRCDQVRPACGQCTNMRKQCPGYRSLTGLRYQHYSTLDLSKGTNGAQYKSLTNGLQGPQRVRKTLKWVPVIDRRSLEASQNALHARMPIPDPQSPSWQHMATTMFLTQYCINLDSIDYVSGGWFDFVPILFNNCEAGSPFASAVSAISLASFANQQGLNWAKVEARRNYGNALTKVNLALREKTTAVEDEILASAIILGLHDNMIGDSQLIFGNHEEGIMNLIQLRGPEQFQTPIGRSIYGHFRTMMRVMDLSRGLTALPWSEEWTTFVASRGDFRQLPWLINRATAFSDQIRSYHDILLQGTDPKLPALLADLHKQGASVIASLKHWQEQNKNFVDLRRTDIVPSSIKQGSQPSYLLTMESPSALSALFLFLISRMCLNWAMAVLSRCIQAQIQMQHYRRSPVEDDLEEAISVNLETLPVDPSLYAASTREVNDDIIALTPFTLGDVTLNGEVQRPGSRALVIKAYILIWALWLVKASDHSSDEQRAWAASSMTRIRHEFGLGIDL